MTVYVWLIAALLLFAAEWISVQLVSIWFSTGALLAFIAAKLGLGLWWQIGIFLVTSTLLLVLTRPIVKKLLKSKNSNTDLDRIIGKSIIISEITDENSLRGKCYINDVSWSVRRDDGGKLEKGEAMTVERIEGVHLIVK
ncbi:MAG: NfeD family protein [Clostridia bacterium]|nr:NfeD family protein [Clostridia bacterium]